MSDFCRIGEYFTACLNYDLIQPKAFMDLKPGDQVNRIGKYPKKSYSSSSRVDEFTKLLTYRGIVEFENEKWLCFEVPPEGIRGFDLFNPERSVCIMYMILQSESKVELVVPYMSSAGGSIRIYKPEFGIKEEILT